MFPYFSRSFCSFFSTPMFSLLTLASKQTGDHKQKYIAQGFFFFWQYFRSTVKIVLNLSGAGQAVSKCSPEIPVQRSLVLHNRCRRRYGRKIMSYEMARAIHLDPLQTPSPPVRLLQPSVFCLSLNACNTRMVAPLFKAIVTVRDEQVGGAEDKLRHHCPPCLFCRPAENGAGARESNRSRCEWHSQMIYCLRASTPFPSDQPQHARERRCSGGSLLFVSGLGSSGVERIYRRNVFVGYKRKC